MLSSFSITLSSPTVKSICFSPSSSVFFLYSNPRRRFCKISCFSSLSSTEVNSDLCQEQQAFRGNYAGFRFEENVAIGNEKSRLDSWISSRIPGISRARIQSSIRSGLVSVNGRIVDKVSHVIRERDKIEGTISELQPLRAEPEDIPLDIVYEDDHVLVVNKPAHMVVHPAPGNAKGTLVNGILHHCKLSNVSLPSMDNELDDSLDDDCDSIFANCLMDNPVSSNNSSISVRPGIVHRLDKGTSGLLVVAKDEHSHAHLAAQFKLHTIHRVYVSLTSGIPSPSMGRVEVPIARDLNNRLRMAAVSGSQKSGKARHAASRYKVIEILACGASALVEWRLETGRTHQIRAHAKHLGIPLLGDEIYGGSKNMALSLLRPRTPSSHHVSLSQLVSKLVRPCLHAVSLGFRHPHTEEDIQFSCPPPSDFIGILNQLRALGVEKVCL